MAMLGNSYTGSQSGAINSIPTPAQPRTISSAIGRISDLNGRLRDINGRLQGIADQIGGPRPVAGTSDTAGMGPAGAVGQLNDAADCAHAQLSDIEDLIAAIGRSLG